ncbi:MAG: purine-nucleoside phosphorylase [Candidatus Latescibacterota bacterium]
MDEFQTQIEEAVKCVRSFTERSPEIGIILGTGIGGLADEIEAPVEIPYQDIPHCPVSTVATHAGKFILGRLGGKKVAVMQGRFHFYEGYSMKQITFPIRVMKALGVKHLIVSCISGGMNPNFASGDLVLLTDHINLIGDNPLIGPNDDALGPRFPDMSEPYHRRLIQLAEAVALEEKIKVQKGVYVAVAGPNLETAAEYRFLRLIGADMVGMSTVPEVIAAVHAGMKVLGISVISDVCLPDALKPVLLSDLLEAVGAAEPDLIRLIRQVVERM